MDRAAYMKKYRAENPKMYERDVRRRERRRKALSILAARHPEEFEKIMHWLWDRE
jgi:hypothetical protein